MTQLTLFPFSWCLSAITNKENLKTQVRYKANAQLYCTTFLAYSIKVRVTGRNYNNPVQSLPIL